MLFKIALKNVKKSYKDFTIYFLTLTMGVCIFYLFNSLESQSVMLSLDESEVKSIQNISGIMNYLSVFVSFVLGFLIIYASNFLITRRKKELGIYLTLGMDRNHVSKVLVYETFVIGFFSLATGLIIGFILSHLFSIVTANMFEMKIESFNFVFSQTAALRTIIYFALIFTIVIILNVIVISRYSLIKLIRAKNYNHEIKQKGKMASIAYMLLSIILLGAAYWLVIKNGIESVGIIGVASAMGVLGTFLFFYAISGFFLLIFQKNKKLYYSGLNTFIIRQFNSRIQETFISTSIICLLISLTIGILSTGASLTKTFNEDYETVVPFDATILAYDYEDNLRQELEENTDVLNLFESYHSYQIYASETTLGDVFKTHLTMNKTVLDLANQSPINVMKLSDYNQLMLLNNKQPISLETNECYLLANFDVAIKLWDEYLTEIDTIKLGENTYNILNRKSYKDGVENSYGAYNAGLIVMNDNTVNATDNNKTILSGNYVQNRDIDFETMIHSLLMDYNDEVDDYYIIVSTRESYIQSALSLRISLSYIGIYLGVVFLIAGSTVLALIQLSEADDNIERYKLLSKLGTSERKMKKSLFISVFISFFTPLTLAIVHSFFGIWWVNNTISLLGKIDILSSVVYTAMIIVTIYGGYFLLTYLGVKRIVQK